LLRLLHRRGLGRGNRLDLRRRNSLGWRLDSFGGGQSRRRSVGGGYRNGCTFGAGGGFDSLNDLTVCLICHMASPLGFDALSQRS
jgi:hypothetical protein